jgi:oxaloacetate decarboxylase gamma subunit
VISQGIELLIFGMGTVVVFLSLLVFAVRLMSAAVLRWFPETPRAPEAAPAAGAAPGQDPSPEVLAVIAAAVHRYRAAPAAHRHAEE